MLSVKDTGEGVFARRDIPPQTLIMNYAGYLIDYKYDAMDTCNETVEITEDRDKNAMSYNDSHRIDIPPRESDTRVFRASLGHKVQHSFRPNAKYEFFNSPRYVIAYSCDQSH